MRGTGLRVSLDCNIIRIIPACAGNRTPVPQTRLLPQDHPRVCGEQVFDAVQSAIQMGSSPRVRGTGVGSVVSTASKRIIPACAGNSSLVKWTFCPFWDHPRVCGEQSFTTQSIATNGGSSPRVRGTASYIAPLKPTTGIIPACAGNRRQRTALADSVRDHPRVCGEQQKNLCPYR